MLTRKEFLRSALVAVGGTLGLGLSGAGCGGDDDGDGGGGTKGCSSSMTNNHGHSLSVSQADIDAGQNKTYSIKGSSAHDHEVLLTANHFASLKAGQSVFVESATGAGHTHNVTVKCG